MIRRIGPHQDAVKTDLCDARPGGRYTNLNASGGVDRGLLSEPALGFFRGIRTSPREATGGHRPGNTAGVPRDSCSERQAVRSTRLHPVIGTAEPSCQIDCAAGSNSRS